jgi:hypothetical protein
VPLGSILDAVGTSSGTSTCDGVSSLGLPPAVLPDYPINARCSSCQCPYPACIGQVTASLCYDDGSVNPLTGISYQREYLDERSKSLSSILFGWPAPQTASPLNSVTVGASAAVSSSGGVSASTANSVGSSAAASTSTARGASTTANQAIGSSQGLSSGSGVGASLAEANAFSFGVSDVSGVGERIAASVGTSVGSSTTIGIT